MNNRRKLLITLGAGALTAPFGALAQQQGKVLRVGFLALPNRAATLDPVFAGAFPLAMRDLGYVEGKDISIEWRFADSSQERLASLAAELVKLKVDVLAGVGLDAALTLQKATSVIPIVIAITGDPVDLGLVKSLARPGGNITGVSTIFGDLGPKRLEMLLTIQPKLSRVAVLLNPSNQAAIKNLESVQAAGRKLGIDILPAEAKTPQEIDNAFSLMRKQNAAAVLVLLHPLFQQQKNQIAELATKHRLPSMTADQMYAEAGCLVSYGPSLAYNFRRVAIYVDKILKGAKPADLPVEQPTKLELVINRKTAKALGLTIPQSLLISADKVIE